MNETNDERIDLEAVTARLHHEVRYLEPVQLLRETFEVSEEEMLERLAAMFGYEGAGALPAPKAKGEVEIDEQIVAWYGLELTVFTFAHPSARKGHTPAYYVPDVNPFLMDLDRFDEPTPGFVLPFPLERTKTYEKKYRLPFFRLRVSLSKTEEALTVGVWFIRCDESEVYWAFHGISGETSATFEKKLREHGGIRIPRADEDEMVKIAERVCKERRSA